MAAKAARRPRGRRGRLRRGRAGLRGLRLRRLHLRPARGVRGGPHRHPGVQREQQLLHGLDGADARRARPSRAASPSACSRSASSRWRRARSGQVERPHQPPRPARRVMNEVQGFNAGARRRRRCSAARAASTAGSTARSARPSRKIAVKARQHASRNPYALFNDTLTLEEVMASPEVFDPLTRYQCCPPTCGAAAAILCSTTSPRSTASQPGLHRRQAMTTDYAELRRLDDQDGGLRHDQERREEGLRAAPASAPKDVDVVELHDCFTANELLTYEASASAPRARPRSSSGTATTPTAASGHQPLGRPAVQGPPARRDGPGAVHRAGLAAPRQAERAR
jgi:hypothetical protein